MAAHLFMDTGIELLTAAALEVGSAAPTDQQCISCEDEALRSEIVRNTTSRMARRRQHLQSYAVAHFDAVAVLVQDVGLGSRCFRDA
jgi:hypothetical protein